MARLGVEDVQLAARKNARTSALINEECQRLKDIKQATRDAKARKAAEAERNE